uniref:(northern house mosquito) hypothetical protein n=1 Tax=Culex pipiens TaxID=7175 RepID=A0A8D8KD65_CULPI
MVIRFSPKGSFVIRAFQWTKLKHDEVNIRSMGFGFNRDMAGNTHTSALLWAGSRVGAQWGFRKAEQGQPKGTSLGRHHPPRSARGRHVSRVTSMGRTNPTSVVSTGCHHPIQVQLGQGQGALRVSCNFHGIRSTVPAERGQRVSGGQARMPRAVTGTLYAHGAKGVRFPSNQVGAAKDALHIPEQGFRIPPEQAEHWAPIQSSQGRAAHSEPRVQGPTWTSGALGSHPKAVRSTATSGVDTLEAVWRHRDVIERFRKMVATRLWFR